MQDRVVIAGDDLLIHAAYYKQKPQSIVALRLLLLENLFDAEYIEGVRTIGGVDLGDDKVIRRAIRPGHIPDRIMSEFHLIRLAGSVTPTSGCGFGCVKRQCIFPGGTGS
jgi:hypothetical protein